MKSRQQDVNALHMCLISHETASLGEYVMSVTVQNQSSDCDMYCMCAVSSLCWTDEVFMKK